MRIDCEKCGAAFAIDDKLIPAKGVRAQCPRCRHIRLVQKPAEPAPVYDVSDLPTRPTIQSRPTEPHGLPNPFFENAPTPPRGVSASDLELAAREVAAGNDAGTRPSSASRASARPPPASASPATPAYPGAELPPLDLGLDTAAPTKAPRGAAGAGPMDLGLDAQPKPPRTSAVVPPLDPGPDAQMRSRGSAALPPLDLDFDSGTPKVPASRAGADVPPLDLGVDSVAPTQVPAQPRASLLGDVAPLELDSRETPSSPATSEGPSTTCRSCGKPLSDPFDQALGLCDECRQKDAEPVEHPTEDVHVPPSGHSSPVVPPPARVAAAGSLKNAARNDGSARGRNWLPLVGVAAAVLVVLIAGAFIARPRWLGFKPPAQPAPVVPEPVRDAVRRWGLAYPGLVGDPAEALKEAQAALSTDTPAAYVDAEEAYQKALILDPQLDEAIIGYARAVALGRSQTVDDATLDEALRLVLVARSRTSDSALSLVAHAELLLCRASVGQNVELARALAERALSAAEPEVQAEAHLVLGRTYAATSLGLALQHFDQASTLSPGLARVQYERALAFEAAGDIRKAMDGLTDRLKADPNQPEALAALSRLYQEVGDTNAARLVYQRVLDTRAGDFQASLMLAVLLYQVEAKPAEAVRALKVLAKQAELYDDRQRVELYVHLAAAQRANGDGDAAMDAVNEALAISKDEPAAHLQGLLLSLDKDLPSEAARHLPFVRGHLRDDALERVIEAMIAFASERFDDAAKLYEEAASKDARRVDAVIMSGVAYARSGKREAALRALRGLPDADPTRSSPRPVVSRFYLPPGETLRQAGTAVGKLSTGASDVAPRLYQALIDWQRGRRDDAESGFREVVSEDAGDSTAHSYLALIAAARRDGSTARSEGERAVAAGKRIAVSHYALGAALVAAGDREQAAREFSDAEALAPGFLGAQLGLAALDVAAKQQDRARDRLVRVLASDPSYLPAKRTLYGIGR